MNKIPNRLSLLLSLVFFVGLSAGVGIADDIGTSDTGTGSIGRCAEDLNSLQLAVRDAQDQADRANVKHDDKLRCNNEPDHKNTQGEDCEIIGQEYQDKINDLDSELKTVESQLKLVQLSCGYDFVLKNSAAKKK